MPNEIDELNVVQDAELLYESIRAMKQISAEVATPSTMRAMLGHLSVAGHLLPEVLVEFGETLATAAASGEHPELAAENVAECQRFLDQAADLAYQAGSALASAKRSLEPQPTPEDD
ncbi:hypothetical protein NODU109028_16085 [Nocardioides dubius]|uniref:Uncharacterized protein n=1 Tax=Nocardioides dubius TaxID=317019 RepID=A0ABN1U1L0_9ACTN